MKPFDPQLFYDNLEAAVAFHRLEDGDPHGINNAVIVSLTETMDALGFAMQGKRTPTPMMGKKK